MDHLFAADQVDEDSFFDPAEPESGFDKNAVVPLAGATADSLALNDGFLQREPLGLFTVESYREADPLACEFFDLCAINGTALGPGIGLRSHPEAPLG